METLNNNGVDTHGTQRVKINNNFTEASNQVTKNGDVVYVRSEGNDGTGLKSRIDKPFLTIGAALDALPSTGGVVDIGVGTFASPVIAKIKSNIWFKGSGKPTFNSSITMTTFDDVASDTPTKLVGGSILQGKFHALNVNGITITDLGIDSGSDFAGSDDTIEGLQITNYNNVAYINPSVLNQGVNIRSIAVLMKNATILGHAVLLENLYNPKVDDVDIFFGYHGFVSKSVGGIFTNINTANNNGEGINLKSNDAPSQGTFVRETILSNFKIINGGDNALLIDNKNVSATGLKNVVISNGIIKGGINGLRFFASDGAGNYENIVVSNLVIEDVTTYGVYGQDLAGVSLSNIIVDAAESGFVLAADVEGCSVVNCMVKNTTGNAYNMAGYVTFSNIRCDNVGAGGNYGLYIDGSLVTGGFYKFTNVPNQIIGTLKTQDIGEIQSLKFADLVPTSKTLTVSSLSTSYTLIAGGYVGIVVIRDNTNGGSSIWMCDPNAGAVAMANNMTGTFSVSFNGSNTVLQKTAGSVPVDIVYTLYPV